MSYKLCCEYVQHICEGLRGLVLRIERVERTVSRGIFRIAAAS